MKNLFIFILFFMPIVLTAQVSDDFSDGDISNNPTWTGDVGSFTVGTPATTGNGAINSDAGNDAFVLSSNANTTDAIITTASTTAYGEWIFAIADGRSWSISGSNDYKIILMSDDNTVANLTDGAMDFNGYFLQFDGGESDQFILYKQTGTTSDIIIDTNFPSTVDGSTPIARTVKITRTATGDWSIFIDEGFEITPTTQVGTTVNDNTHTTSSYFGIATNISSPSTSRILHFDNLQITPLPTNNQTSTVSAGATTEPTTISSLIDTDAEKTFALDFKLSDLASGDVLPTIIDQIKITQGSSNEITDWTQAIAGATLSGTDITGELVGAVTNTDITFAGNDFISIADGTNETYTLKIWLKTDLSGISDNDKLNFKLDFSNIIADGSGSSFGSGNTESGDESIDIQASKINFSVIPTAVVVNSDFIVEVSASDENGNTDTDYTSSTTLAKASGSGNLTSVSGLSKNMILGKANWSDLKYDAEDIFTISANSGAFAGITSGNIQSQTSIIYLNDDFEDGDISDWQSANLSRWSASDDNALNGTYSLKHIFDNTSSDIDKISHPLSSVNLATGTKAWRFQVNYANNTPSGNNNWSVFLMADADNSEMYPTGNINGYVLGVNFADADDVVKLSEVTTGTATPIITTTFDWNNTTNSQIIGFEVQRTATGDWEVKIDENGGFDALTSYGTVNNTAHTTANHFGVYYKYSSTQDMKLTLDDIYFGDIIPDLDAPQLNSLTVNSSNTLKLLFSEDITLASSENISNYNVNNSIGNPTSATLNVDNKTVDLVFATNFTNNQANTLSISNIEDLSGNAISTTNENFTWVELDALSAVPTSLTALDILFSKEIDLTTSQVVANYTVDGGIGNPTTATIDASNNKLIHLVFASNFVLEQNYTITISNVEDTYGNIMTSKNLNFQYFEVQPFDVVINEIMCDVSPAPEGIPPYKYLEIFNNTNHEISLTDWTITIGTNSPKTFTATSISANGYAILCDDDNESDFASYGTVIPILTASQITTTGKQIIIKDKDGNIIENLEYNTGWYNDEDKDGGGWAIERIDPTNFCGEEANWAASTNYLGGTPGSLNSIYAVNPDITAPEVSEIIYKNSKFIQVKFTEKVKRDIAETVTNYTLNSSINPTSAMVNAEDFAIIDLHFADNFNEGTNSLNIINISDNCDNILSSYSGSFDYSLIKPTAIEVMSENQLRVHFSEKIDETTAQNILNYSVNNSIGNPSMVSMSNTDTTVVNLQFSNNFTLGEFYQLSIANIEDVNSNVMVNASLDFSYYIPQSFDIVFNELMFDINPAPVGLEDEIYIELYNNSQYKIDLTNWEFISGTNSAKEFPYISLLPGEYLILCQSDNEEYFSSFGKVAGILSSSDLSTSGKNLKLFSANGTLIDDITYSKDWYDENDNDNGGVSLEKIDATNFCGEEDNWSGSTDSKGGTPGAENSIKATNPDTSIPAIDTLFVVNSNTLKIEFSEKPNTEIVTNKLNFTVNNSIGNPDTIIIDETSRNIVNLKFANQFSDEIENEISVKNIADNCGNVMEDKTEKFTYYLIEPTELYLIDSKHLQINFSEVVDIQTGTTKENYTCDNSIGNPESIIRNANDSTIVHLQFENDFISGEEVTITLKNIEDVNGNKITEKEFKFTYYIPQKNDIVFNELLFNPKTGGSDFIELYNRSDYKIDLSHFQFAKRVSADSIGTKTDISEEVLYIESGEYLAFTVDRDNILHNYLSQNPEGVYEIEKMPSMSDKEGDVILFFEKDSIIDEVAYNEKMHFKLLSDKNGVSLEKINYNKPSNDESNWHSASEYVGFATPAYENSQFSLEENPSDDAVSIDPEIFSPDNDGTDDWTNIQFNLKNAGTVATITIFDAKGRQVRMLVNNKTLGMTGKIMWDGLTDANKVARPGIYTVYFSAYDLEGNIIKEKKTVVIAIKF